MADSGKNAPERIALYGGAFDPVHRAHLAMAQAVLDSGVCSRVTFIPAAQSPLKQARAAAPAPARLRMLEIATADDARLSVDPCELERGGVSYTVDTVRAIRERYPDSWLGWIMGADQFEQLEDWRNVEELASMVHFLVVSRPGASGQVPDIEGLCFERIEAPLMDLSSSEVRERIAAGSDLADYLDNRVEAFIRENGLYTSS